MRANEGTLRVFPELVSPLSTVLNHQSEIAQILIELVWNPQPAAGMQVETVKGWGYAREEILESCLPEFVERHLRGDETWGFYAHSQTGTSRWLCVDIDLRGHLLAEDTEQTVLDALGVILKGLDALEVPESARVMEFSGGKGVHVWILLPETETIYARRFWGVFLENLEPLPNAIGLDLYPNPKTDPRESPWGHLVKLPLALHQKVGRYSCLINEDGSLVEDPLEHLRSRTRWSLPKGLPEVKQVPKPARKRRPSKRREKVLPVGTLDVPHFSHRYRQMIEGCAFLREFHEHPEGVGYHHWYRAGMILTHLGEDGQAWFEYLSAKDVSRFDDSHENVIDAVRSRCYEPPTCSTLGCSQCDKVSPFQCLSYESRFVMQVPCQPEAKPNMTLNELHTELYRELENAIDENEEESKDESVCGIHPAGDRQDPDHLRAHQEETKTSPDPESDARSGG